VVGWQEQMKLDGMCSEKGDRGDQKWRKTAKPKGATLEANKLNSIEFSLYRKVDIAFGRIGLALRFFLVRRKTHELTCRRNECLSNTPGQQLGEHIAKRQCRDKHKKPYIE
jgi:hypothetical protein